MNLLRFGFPLDGVVLTDGAGIPVVAGGVPALDIYPIANEVPEKNLTVNGEKMTLVGNYYRTEKPIRIFSGKPNRLTLCDRDTGEHIVIEVRYFKNVYGKYRFSLDDNIWCFQNLAKNQAVYKSIFEDPYFAMLKRLHEKWGTKFHMNIYYETPSFGGFNLSMLSDKYKAEFKYNSDWLRMSCHANADYPGRPYKNAGYGQTYFEFNRVKEEILRFAGPETLSEKVTTIHFGDATSDAVRAVYDTGVRAMVGTFNWGAQSNTWISYDLNGEQSMIVNKYGIYYEKINDIYYFLYSESGLQHDPLERVPDNLTRFIETHKFYNFIELCVHEQYFYPYFTIYIPNYEERFETGIRWCVEHGYKSTFISEAFDL